MRWVGVMGSDLLQDDAGGGGRPIINLLDLRVRGYHIERLGGPGETSGQQKAGDNGEEEVFVCLHRRQVSPTL